MSVSWRPNPSHRIWQFVKTEPATDAYRQVFAWVCVPVDARMLLLLFKLIFRKEDDGVLGLGAGKSRLVDGMA